MKSKPSTGEIITALDWMASRADERGHYSFCRLDAGWARLAITRIIDLHTALKVCRANMGALPQTDGWREAKTAADAALSSD